MRLVCLVWDVGLSEELRKDRGNKSSFLDLQGKKTLA